MSAIFGNKTTGYNKKMDTTTHSLEAFQLYATQSARGLVPHARFARIITLSGDLGAGKTTFTQAFARELGVKEIVTSPTFIVYKVYDLPEHVAFERLVHVDAYRLESAEELRTHGFDALLQDIENIVIIEWPEKVPGLLKGIPHQALTISVVGENDRTITLHEVSD